MTATQGRLADTIDVFYSAADKASESAMAAHSYKRAIDDLDTGMGRELVRLLPVYSSPRFLTSLPFRLLGITLPYDHHGTPRQDERHLPCRERADW